MGDRSPLDYIIYETIAKGLVVVCLFFLVLFILLGALVLGGDGYWVAGTFGVVGLALTIFAVYCNKHGFI